LAEIDTEGGLGFPSRPITFCDEKVVTKILKYKNIDYFLLITLVEMPESLMRKKE